MKGIDDRRRDGGGIIRIPLYKPFKSRVMEQDWCRRCGESINYIFCSKSLKWGVLKVDDSQGRELGENGGGCCLVKNEFECSWGDDR